MKSINYRKLFMTIISCLLMLLVIEFLAKTYLFNVETFGHSLTHTRNPAYRRGWVEYTAPVEITTDRLIILITGSQAWAPEIADDNAIYPYLLENRLNENSSESYTVLNWAVPGLDFPEYVILMSRLAAFDPDLVLFIVDWKDMIDNLSQPLSVYGTDVIRLAYHPAIRKNLSTPFLDQHKAHDPLDAIQNLFYVGLLHSYLLVDEPSHWGHTLDEEFVQSRHYGRIRNNTLDDWQDNTDWYLINTMATYLTSIGETPLITIASPQYFGWYDADTQEKIRTLAEHVQQLWGSLSFVQVVDGIEWIPQELFFNAAHFDENGHKLMAEKLYPLILQTLDS